MINSSINNMNLRESLSSQTLTNINQKITHSVNIAIHGLTIQSL